MSYPVRPGAWHLALSVDCPSPPDASLIPSSDLEV